MFLGVERDDRSINHTYLGASTSAEMQDFEKVRTGLEEGERKKKEGKKNSIIPSSLS